MRPRWLLIFILPFLSIATPVFSQIPTVVTGTVIDINGLPYSFAKVSAQLIPSTASPTILVNGNPVQIGGQQNANADVNGTFSMNLFCNAAAGGCSVVSPSATQWQFTVTTTGVLPPFGTGPQACTATLSITNLSQSISASFNTCPAQTKASSLTGIPGNGTVTTFSSGNLSPLFTTSVATPTTTPALSYVLANAAANTVFGNCTGSSAAPNYCALTAGMLPAGSSVTSVGLALPPQYSISGSPVTSAGTLTGAWLPEPSNYVLGGPALNSIGGIFDGSSGTTGNSTSLSATLTPSTAHDWAFFIFQAQPGVSSQPTMPGGWSQIDQSPSGSAIFQQVFSSSATITATASMTPASTWAAELFLLRLPAGSPTIVQHKIVSSIFTNSIPITFTSNTTTGNTIIATVCGVPPSGTQISGKFTDSQLNIYTQIGFAQNGGAEVCISAMTATILGGVTPTVTFTSSGSYTSSILYAMEVSNIATATGEPVFRALLPGDFPANISGPPVRAFTSKNLAGDVAVTANVQATIDSITVTMPSTGGPWRVQVAYDYFFSGGLNGECFVTDGTNTWALMEWQPLSNIGSCQNTQWSNGTYGNGAVVTFTVNVFDNGATTVKATSTFHAATPSYMQVAVFSTN